MNPALLLSNEFVVEKFVSFCDQSFFVSDLWILVGFCLGIWLVFSTTEVHLSSMKSKAWIIMLISSFGLSVFGTHAVMKASYHGLWSNEYIYSEDSLSRTILLFFIATNIMDLWLGMYHYPKFIDPLSTIAHHIFYIIFITTLLAYHYSTGFILCFFMEIPTFVLAVGSVWEPFRSDLLFGMSFILTRLVYNAWLAFTLATLSPEGLIWKICVLVLMLHCYWFQKWYETYGKPLYHSLFSHHSTSTPTTITNRA
jgi:hypothetical protein